MFRVGCVLGLGFLAAVGCQTENSGTKLVSSNTFDANPPATRLAKMDITPAAVEIAQRVDLLGRRLVAANQQAGVRPMFRTIGAPQPEVFHRGTEEIDITEGLVRQCQTDGQLAAVLCQEMGKMVSEREAIAGPRLRVPERRPPMDVPIGNDGGGAFGTPDQTHLAELGKFEREQRGTPASGPLPPPPDPAVLARSYLKKAEFAETELDGAALLLAAAAANCTFEKQFTTVSWQKPAGP